MSVLSTLLRELVENKTVSFYRDFGTEVGREYFTLLLEKTKTSNRSV